MENKHQKYTKNVSLIIIIMWNGEEEIFYLENKAKGRKK